MKRIVQILGLVSLVSSLHPASAATYLVRPDGSGDFPTIQAAIQAAVNGDVIELADGVFRGPDNRDLWLNSPNSAITIRSSSGDPLNCTIDCQGSAGELRRGFRFNVGCVGFVLEGVTITHGYADGPYEPYNTGGAVLCEQASPRFVNCRFYENTSNWWGGGVSCYGGSPAFVRCSFEANSGAGGGVMTGSYAAPTFEECLFVGNHGLMGGGMFVAGVSGTPGPVLSRCTFSGNTVSGDGGAILTYSTVTLIQCTFYGNTAAVVGGNIECTMLGARAVLQNTIVAFASAGGSVTCSHGGSASLTCCDVFGNAGGDGYDCVAGQIGLDGNISADPLFCDPQNGDFTLREDSPCAPFTPPNEECDLIGAWPAGCSPPTPTLPVSWGRIKATYSR
jgi:predicted outer membrane repeat protein